MASTKPSMSDVLNDLRNQNANLPTEKKQNIIVVQDTGAGSDDKSGQMLTVLNSIFNAVSEQLRLTRESLNLQKQDRLEAKDFQKEAMDVSSGKYEPPEYSSGGTASSAGEGGGIVDTVGKVGGGLWEGVKGVGKAITGVAARHPIGTAIGVGAAAGLGIGTITKTPMDKGLSKQQLELRQHLIAGMDRAGITDPKERAAFLAQAHHETDNFNTIKEYGGGKASNVKGGKQYYGRGFLQITNKDNYQKIGKMIGKDIVSNPDLLLDPDIAADASIAYWKSRVSPKVKDFGDVRQVTRGINPGEIDNPKYMKNWRKRQETFENYMRNSDEFAAGKSYNQNNPTSTKITNNGIPLTHGEGLENKRGDPNWAVGMRPLAAEKIQQVLDIMESKGYKSTVLEGRRADERQAQLYAQGRTKPGNIVTYKKHSEHQEGIAADIARLDEKGNVIPTPSKIVTKEQKAYYKALGEAAHSVGLRWGGSDFGKFIDAPHVELSKQDKKIAGELPNLQRLASNGEQLPKSGKHQLERTDEKSSVLQASMFAPLQTAFDRMTNVLEKIAGNTKDTKDEIKASRTEDKESPSATKTNEEPTKTYKPTDYLSEEDKKKYDEAQQKALNESLKTGKKEITEDDIMKHLSDDDKVKFNKAKEDAKAASLAESNATRMEPEKDLNDALANLPKGEGSDVMRMLFGQGGAIMGSAEPIEPGSPKRKFLDSLPTYNDELWEYVKGLVSGEGNISEEGLQGALQSIGKADTSGVMGGLLGMGNGSATPQGTGDQLKNLGVTPMSGTEQFLNNLGITPYNNQQENRLTTQKENQLSNIGVTGFGDALKTFGGSNNPFFSMQNVLGQVGSMANMGQNIGGMMQQGGLGAIQGVMGQMGGVLSGMGQGFPMMQGIGGMLGQAGNMIGAVRGFENMGRGGFGGNGVMGGIGAASSVLGSLGNVFGGMQRMGGGLSGMGVTPFGQGQGMLGGLMNTATSLGSSIGGMFGGIGDSLGGLFGESNNNVSSKGIGDDAASISNKYSDLIMNQTGQNLDSLQSSNDSLSSMSSGSSGGSSNQSSGMPGRNASAPADTGSMGSSMGASGGAGFKSGDKRAGSSAGAMGNSINPYNNCNVLYQWLYRNMWWAKV